MKTFLSIDIGTSAAKLSLYDAQGQVRCTRSASYPLEIPRPGWAEQDPRDWWRAVCRLGPEIMAGLGGNQLAAICVSGQAPLCVAVGADGEPLRKAILWLDRRATPQVAWLAQRVGEERARQVSANRLDSYFGGVKWLWFRQEEPELYDRTWKIMQANGYVAWRLTGQAATDPSQAGLCSPCYDYAAGTWQAEVCAQMGLDPQKLPEIFPSQAVIGEVGARAALECGLPAGTPVVCGGGDFACACLGAGVTGPGRAALMLGTAGNLLFPGVFNPDPRLLHTRHVTGQALTFGGVLAGGNLSWLAGLFDQQNNRHEEHEEDNTQGTPSGREHQEEEPLLTAQEMKISFYEQQDRAAAQLAPGCDGLVYLPYLMGERTPIWDPEARGAFVGLSSRHTRTHLYRAVLEGVAFAFRQVLEITGTRGLEEIVAIDGGARSAIWRSILASTLGVPVRRGSLRAGTGLGAAFLAALGVGEAASFEDIAGWGETSAPSLPDPEAGRRYDRLYAVYAGLYPKLKADFWELQSQG